ncbi:MAG: dihydropteroate synthase [Emcibacteraceae bacterium]|nr:dihydropteroate synthase [Emcibacteraceae bacterium]
MSNDRVINKIYVQPLGLLKGLTVSCENFKKIASGSIYFSTLKVIIRSVDDIKEEIISVADLPSYLEASSYDVRNDIIRLLHNIESKRPVLKLANGLELNWNKPIIQGVLNVTPDSFSDGGQYHDIEKSISHAREMVLAGAEIIDIGGESTKPGAKPVSIDEEKHRVIPVIKELNDLKIPLSIDSRNSEVMEKAISDGVHIINDVSALSHDPESIKIVKKCGVPVILMHAQGTPDIMQDSPKYNDVLLDIYDYLEAQINFCLEAGIAKNKIIIDPGIGFGKTLSHNLNILANLAIFHGLGVPLLIGVSRKSFIGEITGEGAAENRFPGSIAAALTCLDQGAQIIRVHDVAQTKQALSVWYAIH